MTLAIPNIFVSGTAMSASAIQTNNDAVKVQLNGGIVAADRAASAGFDLQHIMNGEYLPTNIDYDMTSGHEIGAQELPRMLVGALPRFWAIRDRTARTVPRTGTTFYLKQQADVLFRFDAAVQGYESETAAPFTSSRAELYINIDGTNYGVTKYIFTEESDWGSSVGGGEFPGWEKRRSYNGHFILFNMAAGEHTVSLAGNADAQAFFIKAFSFTIEAHYD